MQAYVNTNISLNIRNLLVGREVIAKKHEDRYFYKGRIIKKISENSYLVEFPFKNVNWNDFVYQKTNIHDILDLTDAYRRSTKQYDKVLAKIDEKNCRYAPGEVLDIKGENRIIKFFNGKTIESHSNDIVWIPDLIFEQTKYELCLPSTTWN